MRVMVRKEDGDAVGVIDFEVVPRSGERVVIDGVARSVRHIEHFVSSTMESGITTVVLRTTDADYK